MNTETIKKTFGAQLMNAIYENAKEDRQDYSDEWSQLCIEVFTDAECESETDEEFEQHVKNYVFNIHHGTDEDWNNDYDLLVSEIKDWQSEIKGEAVQEKREMLIGAVVESVEFEDEDTITTMRIRGTNGKLYSIETESWEEDEMEIIEVDET